MKMFQEHITLQQAETHGNVAKCDELRLCGAISINVK